MWEYGAISVGHEIPVARRGLPAKEGTRSPDLTIIAEETWISESVFLFTGFLNMILER